MDFDNPEITWVPWRRYAVLIRVDGRTVMVERFMLRKTAEGLVDRLTGLMGLEMKLIDTKNVEDSGGG